MSLMFVTSAISISLATFIGGPSKKIALISSEMRRLRTHSGIGVWICMSAAATNRSLGFPIVNIGVPSIFRALVGGGPSATVEAPPSANDGKTLSTASKSIRSSSLAQSCWVVG